MVNAVSNVFGDVLGAAIGKALSRAANTNFCAKTGEIVVGWWESASGSIRGWTRGVGEEVAPRRVFTSVDRHVAETANKLDDQFPGRVVDVNQSLPASVAGGTREVDILMDQFVIQVKQGRATGLARQIKETQATIVDQGKRVIGYAPDNYSGHAWTGAANEGIPIARNFDELVAIIKELSN